MKKKLLILNILIFALVGISYLLLQMTKPLSYEFTDMEMEKYTADGRTVVIKPILTANAYSGGYYKYYAGLCGTECLNIPINQTDKYIYTSSKNAIKVLEKMHYPMITDYDLHKNPKMIQKYDRVIVLHSEYVTQEIFDALQNHKDVIYLYPNALYGKIKIHEENGKDYMRLVQGHNYPLQSITNGFDWEYENSAQEYDKLCKNYTWNKISNGYQLSCYPENSFYQYKELLSFIKEPHAD